MKATRRLSETTIIENHDAPIFNFCHLPDRRPATNPQHRSNEHPLPILMIERWDGSQLFSLQYAARKRAKHT